MRNPMREREREREREKQRPIDFLVKKESFRF